MAGQLVSMDGFSEDADLLGCTREIVELEMNIELDSLSFLGGQAGEVLRRRDTDWPRCGNSCKPNA